MGQEFKLDQKWYSWVKRGQVRQGEDVGEVGTTMSLQERWGQRLVERFGDRLLDRWVSSLYEGLGDSLGKRLGGRLGQR